MEENNFSTFIKELRMEKGLSQEELAKALYVHRTTVNKWENDNVIPLNDKLLLIADYFDISVDELLNGKRSDINTASSTRNNTIVELIKSKTKSQKLLIYSVLGTLIIILCFLAYYFISNYNSIEYMVKMKILELEMVYYSFQKIKFILNLVIFMMIMITLWTLI